MSHPRDTLSVAHQWTPPCSPPLPSTTSPRLSSNCTPPAAPSRRRCSRWWRPSTTGACGPTTGPPPWPPGWWLALGSPTALPCLVRDRGPVALASASGRRLRGRPALLGSGAGRRRGRHGRHRGGRAGRRLSARRPARTGCPGRAAAGELPQGPRGGALGALVVGAPRVQWRLSGHLSAEEGAVVERALAAIADRAPRRPETGLYDPYAVRAADALVELAEAGPAVAEPRPVHPGGPRRCRDAGRPERAAEVENGPALSAEAARRLAATLVSKPSPRRPTGPRSGIGPCRRPGSSLDRAGATPARQTGGGCRLGAHAGPLGRRGQLPTLGNLVSLCGHHHRLVHEGGWRLAGHPDRHLTFLRPNGQPFRAGPEPLQPRVRERLVEPLLPRGPDPPG